MKLFFICIAVALSCTYNSATAQQNSSPQKNKALDSLFTSYYEEGLQLFPLNATSIGDNRYNNLLPIDFTDSYREVLRNYYNRYLTGINNFRKESLNEEDRLSYAIFKRDVTIALEGLNLKDNRMPFDQFTGLPLTLGQLGSGDVIQPFKTVKDYDDWLARASGFAAWADSAIAYFRKGMAENIVLPKTLVIKMIPQMQAFVSTDATKSVYYGPINKLPADFSATDKKRFTDAYVKLITEQITPSYKKLSDFLQKEYLPKARGTSGLGAVPGGDSMYHYYIKLITTTNKTGDELYNTGLSEVKRIRTEMERIKSEVGFKGDLKAFFTYMKTDPRFLPYKTPEDVLNDYRAIQKRIEPNLKKMFNHTPKTSFEVRQTEAFRAASASAEYFQGVAGGSRPGIFYVPIIDVSKTTTARESLFLHEAIPGHHYQIMLQYENENLPQFRRYGGNSAYIEGWGLYSESLGKELGLYKDPYQYMRALGDEIHRAIRLVVDPGMHAKGWSREKAIQYMMDNEPIEEQRAVAEIERYMAIPAQALAYKVGALKIQELRAKYTKQLGSQFNLAAFHDELLKDGAMPLDVLEMKMDAWAAKQKR